MLLLARISAVLGGFFIATYSFSAIVLYEKNTQNESVFSNYFHAIIDVNTGGFIMPSDEGIVLKESYIEPKKVSNLSSQKLSPIKGGGIIVNINSFSQMRVVKDKNSAVKIQCSTFQK